MYTFYILFSSARNKYYVGHTGDRIEERLRKHNSNHMGYTGKVRDWEIVYAELYHLKEEAYRREREVKGWKSRIKIKNLVRKKYISWFRVFRFTSEGSAVPET